MNKMRTLWISMYSTNSFNFIYCVKVRYEGVTATGGKILIYDVMIKTLSCELQPTFAKPGM